MINSKKQMSTTGFILSAIGAAVGLGNIWGFPTKMLQHGGPAFLIPFLIAVLVIGLPLLILEINMGHKWRKAPTIFYKHYLGKHGSSFAWFQAGIQLLLGTYYAIIIAWVLLSIFSSFKLEYVVENDFIKKIIDGSWFNTDKNKAITNDLKLKDFLINPIIFTLFFFVILMTGIVVSRGLKGGIEKINKIIIPALFVLFIVLFIYTLTLEGAKDGINKMFTPNIEKLKNGAAWSSGFSQAIFTFSLGVSIIIIFSASSPKYSDNTNKAIVIVVADTMIALIACAIISSTLGALSNPAYGKEITMTADKIISNKTNKEIVGASIVFEIFPKLFNLINQKVHGLGTTISLMFYVSVFFAAFSSMISLIEPTVTNLEQGRKIDRKKAVIIACFVQFIFGLIYTTKLKTFFKETTSDTYVDKLLILSIIMWLSMILFSKNFVFVKELINHNNEISIYKIGKKFIFILFCSLIILITIFVWGWVDFAYAINDSTKDLYKITWWQWTFSLITFFVPFSFLVFVLGYIDFWKKSYMKFKGFLNKKIWKI